MLGDLGGRTLDETVRRILQYVFNTELALQFSVFGRHGKRAFGTSSLFSVVFRTFCCLILVILTISCGSSTGEARN